MLDAEEAKTEKPAKSKNKDRKSTQNNVALQSSKDPGVHDDDGGDLLYADDLHVAPDALAKTVKLGYNKTWTEEQLRAGANNHCTTTYHLVSKD